MMAVAKRVLKRLYKTKATRTHTAYQKYVKEEKVAGRKPLTFKAWAGSKEPMKVAPKKLYKRKPGTIKELRQAREAARAKSRRR